MTLPNWIKRGLEEKAHERDEREKNRPVNLHRLPMGTELLAEMQFTTSNSMNLTVVECDDDTSLIGRQVVFNAPSAFVSKHRDLLGDLLPGDRLRIVSRKHSRLAPITDIYIEVYSRHLTEKQRLTVFSARKAQVAHGNMEFFFDGIFEKLSSLNYEHSRHPNSSYCDTLREQIRDAKKHVRNLQEKSYKLSLETLTIRGLVEEDQYYS